MATRQLLRAHAGPQDIAPMAIFRVSRRVHRACFTGEMAAQPDRDTRVALVAGATRGAGRAIAVELARAGLFVYATGRSSRVSGRSEIDRPETIEKTGDRIRAAGGRGSALVVDHENPRRSPGYSRPSSASTADRWAGMIVSARQLADAYGVTDTDGSRPDCWGYLAEYGWERDDGEGVDRFR